MSLLAHAGRQSGRAALPLRASAIAATPSSLSAALQASSANGVRRTKQKLQQGRIYLSAHRALSTSAFLSAPSSSTPLSAASSPSAAPAREKLFSKILIANRGEIACRVIKSCQKLGIKTVAIYSEPDARALHVRMADEAYCVGPAASSQSYLNIDRIMEVIQKTGAEAVHPGYGFLSENKTFQERLQAAGIKFIGPGTHAITAMGDKITSKRVAQEAGVNIIPGFLGEVKDEEDVVRISNEIGYPVMVKASGGGGGKGMRVAYNDAEARSGYQLSKAEALSSFGNDMMFVEKFIEEPRHIEIQLLVDSHGNAIYLNERECSVQRRNQKVIEEAPSVFLDVATRKAMGEQAVALAKAVGYESAGTCEFLVDKHRNFYFLEMNTRLQVEHPVTEQITGVDIVEQMIRIAAGHKVNPVRQEDVKLQGWALESRVYAEDPLRGFLPSIGHLQRYIEPVGENVRVDSGIVEGSEISIHYDPMISKLITFGKDRNEALAHMRKALDSYVIRGLTHNVNFLRSLCDHPRFIEGRLTTNFIPEEYPQGYKGADLSKDDGRALVSAAVLVRAAMVQAQTSLLDPAIPTSFNRQAFVGASMRDLIVTFNNPTTGESVQFKVRVNKIRTQKQSEQNEEIDEDQASTLELDMGLQDVSNASATTEPLVVRSTYKRGDLVFDVDLAGGRRYTLQVLTSNDGSSNLTLSLAGTSFNIDLRTPREAALLRHMPVPEVIDTSKLIVSPMPGAVHTIKVQVGDEVAAGQEVVIVEAMKMQNALRAASPGKVKAIHVKPGQTVTADQTLIEFE